MYKHDVEMCRPMCEIQKVAKTQSVQSITCDRILEDLIWWIILKWFDHKHDVERPMCEIQEVARTQSVQSITGNSPLSISLYQHDFSILDLNCKILFSSPLSVKSPFWSQFTNGWLHLKWSQVKNIFYDSKNISFESLKLHQSESHLFHPHRESLNRRLDLQIFILISKSDFHLFQVWIEGWICWLDLDQ